MERKYWYQKQLRMLQTVLREPDLEGYDVQQVVRYLKETNSNAIIVNAGGLIDFFPNKEPLGRKNRFMTERDILKELIQACHDQDISVVARVDFRGVEDTRYEQQPDWFAIDEEGNSKLGWNNLIHKPCYNGIYANDHAVSYIRHLLTDYDFDGVWENSVGFGDGPCYCQRCREAYRKTTGKEIPVGGEYGEEVFEEYRNWKAGCAKEHLKRMRKAVKHFGEEKAYCAEIFGMFHVSNAVKTGIDLYQAKDLFDFLVSPAFLDGSAQPDRKYDELTYASSSMRFLKSIGKEKQAVMLYGNNGTKWRYVMAPRQETRIWLWEAVSTGAGIWNCLFNGQHPGATFDKRNACLEKDIYSYMKENEETLSGLVHQMDVGIFFSKDTRDRFGNDKEERDDYGVFIKGAERALTQNHIQYSFVSDLDFSYDEISGLDAILLTNAACMSSGQVDIIRKYVENGGGLVATYQTSLYDEKGKRRNDFGLSDLFGCSFIGIIKDTSTDSYQKIRASHPILDLVEPDKTELLMNEGKTLLCKPYANTQMQTICTYVPLIYNQPPEFAWIPDMDTEYPTIIAGNYGKGKVVYFANQTDKLCYTNGHEDFASLYIKALEWVKKKPFLVKTNAPESVHITLTARRENMDCMVLSIVNTTSGTVRPIRDLVSVYDFWIDLTDMGDEITTWDLLHGEGAVTVSMKTENGKKILHIEISKLDEFIAISIKK